MISIFYIASIIAVLVSFKVISSTAPFSALVYLVISLLASATVLFSLGAYFSAVLQILLFIGATGILFIATISFLDLNTLKFKQQEKRNLTPKIWLGPLILIFVLFVMLLFSIVNTNYGLMTIHKADVDFFSMKDILLGPYILVIELAGLLILGAIVVAYHFAKEIIQDENIEDVDKKIEVVFVEEKMQQKKGKKKV